MEDKPIVSPTGGFLIPLEMSFPKKGIKAWLYRLFKDERGWEKRNLYNELLERVKTSEIKRV